MSRLAAAPLLALALAACAVPEWQKPGTPLADIERTMGRPTLAEPLESGGQRLVYSRQPAGQHAAEQEVTPRQHQRRRQSLPARQAAAAHHQLGGDDGDGERQPGDAPQTDDQHQPEGRAGFHGVMLRPCSGWMKLATSSAT